MVDWVPIGRIAGCSVPHRRDQNLIGSIKTTMSPLVCAGRTTKAAPSRRPDPGSVHCRTERRIYRCRHRSIILVDVGARSKEVDHAGTGSSVSFAALGRITAVSAETALARHIGMVMGGGETASPLCVCTPAPGHHCVGRDRCRPPIPCCRPRFRCWDCRKSQTCSVSCLVSFSARTIFSGCCAARRCDQEAEAHRQDGRCCIVMLPILSSCGPPSYACAWPVVLKATPLPRALHQHSDDHGHGARDDGGTNVIAASVRRGSLQRRVHRRQRMPS